MSYLRENQTLPFLTQRESLATYHGENLDLICEKGSSPQTNWYFGEQIITKNGNSNHQNFLVLEFATLIVLKIFFANKQLEGTYKCKNSRNDMFRNIDLTVLNSEDGELEILNIGDEMDLMCRAPDGYDGSQVSWIHNFSNSIMDSEPVTWIVRDRLADYSKIIVKGKINSGGIYQCFFRGSVIQSFFIKINPEWENVVEMEEGDNNTELAPTFLVTKLPSNHVRNPLKRDLLNRDYLPCDKTDRKQKVYWKINRNLYKCDDTMAYKRPFWVEDRIMHSRLYISSLTKEHMGFYECFYYENNQPRHLKTFALIAEDSPNCHSSRPSFTYVEVDEDQISAKFLAYNNFPFLECRNPDDPTTAIQWVSNGIPFTKYSTAAGVLPLARSIPNAVETRLYLFHVSENNHTGLYTCYHVTANDTLIPVENYVFVKSHVWKLIPRTSVEVLCAEEEESPEFDGSTESPESDGSTGSPRFLESKALPNKKHLNQLKAEVADVMTVNVTHIKTYENTNVYLDCERSRENTQIKWHLLTKRRPEILTSGSPYYNIPGLYWTSEGKLLTTLYLENMTMDRSGYYICSEFLIPHRYARVIYTVEVVSKEPIVPESDSYGLVKEWLINRNS